MATTMKKKKTTSTAGLMPVLIAFDNEGCLFALTKNGSIFQYEVDDEGDGVWRQLSEIHPDTIVEDDDDDELEDDDDEPEEEEEPPPRRRRRQ